jgi:hypothetical protein
LYENLRGPGPKIPAYLRIDLLAGLLVCVAAGVIWFESMDLAIGQLRYFGPGFLPKIASVVLVAGGLALVARGFLQPATDAQRLVLAARGPTAVSLAILFFATTIKGVAVRGVEIPQLGLFVTGPVTVLIAGLGSVEANPRELMALGIGLTALVVLVFVDLLSVQIPVFPQAVADHLPADWGPDWPRRIVAVLGLCIAYGLWRRLAQADGAMAARRNEVHP